MNAMISKVVSKHQKDWNEFLTYVVVAYRSSCHEVTGFSPNFYSSRKRQGLPWTWSMVAQAIRVWKDLRTLITPCHFRTGWIRRTTWYDNILNKQQRDETKTRT